MIENFISQELLQQQKLSQTISVSCQILAASFPEMFQFEFLVTNYSKHRSQSQHKKRSLELTS